MTIRGKFNLAMLVMFVMMLGTALVVHYLVSTVARTSLAQGRMRELSVFTDDVRAEIFYQIAMTRGFGPMRAVEGAWPGDVLEDVDIRIHHATFERERANWHQVRSAIVTLASGGLTSEEEINVVREADNCLRGLRRAYDERTASALAQTAGAVSFAQGLAFIAALVSTAVFAIVILLVRDWLVRPIQVLSDATMQIGKGALDHRVTLRGRDELSMLADRVNEMAASLTDHQRQLLEAREMAAIGSLCTQVAHGLRNPLAGMRAGTQLACKRLQDDAPSKAMFQEFIAEIDGIDARITRLFDFSQPGELACCDVTLAELLALALADAQPALDAHHIEVHTDDQTDGRIWRLDPARLSGALAEILTNAVHHSVDGGAIELTGRITCNGRESGDGLQIVIRDHGRGMHPNAARRAFEVFFTTRTGGTGMGLPLVQRIVNQLGGTIALDSRLDDGTRIEINLPATARP